MSGVPRKRRGWRSLTLMRCRCPWFYPAVGGVGEGQVSGEEVSTLLCCSQVTCDWFTKGFWLSWLGGEREDRVGRPVKGGGGDGDGGVVVIGQCPLQSSGAFLGVSNPAP